MCRSHRNTWLVRSGGSPTFVFCKRLKTTRKALHNRNKELFGFIQFKIKQLCLKLDALQCNPKRDQTGWRERDIRGRLQKELKREEMLWKNKSRVSWFTTSDLNTKFFRISTIVCHRRNCIDALKSPDETWFRNCEQIGNLFV